MPSPTAESLTENVVAAMENYLDDLSGPERTRAVLAAVFGPDARRLIARALADQAENCDRQVLADVGRDEVDACEVNPEDDAAVEALLDQRAEDLAAEYRRLTTLFWG